MTIKALNFFALFLITISCSRVYGQSQPFEINNIPQATVSGHENIQFMDFITDNKGIIYLVWTVGGTNNKPVESKTFFSKSTNEGKSWSNPINIAGSPLSKIKLIKTEAPTVLHLFFADGKEHFISIDEGVAWKQVNAIAAEERIQAFDIIATKDRNLIAAYLVKSKGNTSSQESLDVLTTRWDSQTNAMSKPEHITTFGFGRSSISSNALKLAYNGNVLHIVCAIKKMTTITQGNTTSYSDSTFLYDLSSQDNGIKWSSAQDVLGSEKYAKKNHSSIMGINLLSTDKDLLILYLAERIYVKALSDREHPPVDIINYSPGALSPDFYVMSLASVPFKSSGVVVWIDSRFTKTDRKWWKPLGGWPWSDQPDWSNNDIFLMGASTIQRLLQSSKPEQISQNDYIRITPPLSVADVVRIHTLKQDYIVMWTGRWQIGGSKNSPKESNEIFMVKVPITTIQH